jgi:quercetin dioxygenase-like cupin family protein
MTDRVDDPGLMHAVQNRAGSPLSVGDETSIAGLAGWTGGAFNVLDQVLPPGLIVAPHRHEKEAQAAFVLSGTVGFWVDGEEVELGPGGYIHRPANVPHSLWNGGSEPARMLEITSPGDSFEIYIQAMSDLLDSGGANPDSVAELAGGYGVHFVPGPLADLCERHGVSPAGGFWK